MQVDNQSNILTYPSDLAEKVPSFLQIAVKSFDVYNAEQWQDPDQFQFTGTIGKIINLPIPAGLVDQSDAAWNNDLTNHLVQNAVNQFLDSSIIAKTGSNAAGVYGEKHVVHTFEGITAKPFSLVYNFLPQNRTEAQTVEEIIKQLRRAQLPSTGIGPLSTRFMRYPDMLELKIIGKSSQHQKFLPTFITSISVDRNFDDTWIEYPDGFTPSILLNLSLVEISNYTKEIFDRVYGL